MEGHSHLIQGSPECECKHFGFFPSPSRDNSDHVEIARNAAEGSIFPSFSIKEQLSYIKFLLRR